MHVRCFVYVQERRRRLQNDIEEVQREMEQERANATHEQGVQSELVAVSDSAFSDTKDQR